MLRDISSHIGDRLNPSRRTTTKVSDEMTIDKREELLAATAVGLGLVAQGLVKLSDVTQHAAVVLAKVAESLEEQQKARTEAPPTPSDGPGTASPGSSGATGPYGSPPQARGPWDQPPSV
jgi:hypothetical protein